MKTSISNWGICSFFKPRAIMTTLILFLCTIPTVAQFDNQKLTPNDEDPIFGFGCSVSVDGEYAIVGARNDDENGARSGSAYIFVNNGGEWTQHAKLIADDANEDDYFGWSVSIDGDYAIVGAYMKEYEEDWDHHGAAYIFVRNGDSWSQQARLQGGLERVRMEHFGYSVSIDGDYAIVGAWMSDVDIGDEHESWVDRAGSASIFVRDGNSWSQQALLTKPALEGSDRHSYFGNSVSIAGDYALIGCYGDSQDDLQRAGSAYIYVRDGNTWSHQVRLTADDAEEHDNFGRSVSIDGDNALVGANGSDEDDVGDAGSAYVFIRDDNEWSQQAKLIADDARATDRFGYFVSIDGNYALVGTEDVNSAYIFVRGEDDWAQLARLKPDDSNDTDFGKSVSIDGNNVLVGGISTAFTFNIPDIQRRIQQQQKITADDANTRDNFGISVSVDGDYAIVGAEVEGLPRPGSAYIFVRNGDEWLQAVKLTADDGEERDRFGCSVSIDGDYAIVGTEDRGAYIFVRNGDECSQQAKLTSDERSFGSSVSIDGNYAIVGAAGCACIFVRSGDEWSQQATLTGEDAGVSGEFGCSVSIDGGYAIIGARTDDIDDINDTGSASIFVRNGNSWSHQAILTADDGTLQDYFGKSVSISGNYALVGAYRNDDDEILYTGSAYIFVRNGNTWSQNAKLTADDAAQGDEFGWSVSIDGDNALVGARYDDCDGSNSGSAYLFVRDGDEWQQRTKLSANYGGQDKEFGYSVSIDGDYAFCGTPKDRRNYDYNDYPGSAHICNLTGLVADVKLSPNRDVPQEFNLGECYPNPFNSRTRINYSIPKPCLVSIKVFNLNGRLVESLINSEISVGYHSVQWNAKELNSGLYFIHLETSDFVGVQKVVLTK